jgi:hypothetical protein
MTNRDMKMQISSRPQTGVRKHDGGDFEPFRSFGDGMNYLSIWRRRWRFGGGYSVRDERPRLAADRYTKLPLELRLAALCLPMPEKLARAA